MIRALDEFDGMDKKRNVVRLWAEVKKQYTLGTAVNTDLEKIRRDADNRFQLFHQVESVSTFIDKFTNECEASVQAGNAFVETEFITSGNKPVDLDPLVKDAKKRIMEKADKIQALIF